MSETRVTHEAKLDLPKECDHIVGRALAGEDAIVQMGCLMFVAFSSGDAFALDLDHKVACPLCLGREKQPYGLTQTGTQWAFQWPWRYSVSRGRIHVEWIDGEDSSGLPRLPAGTIKRRLTDYNRKAGTNFRL
jgi:hypothetical protein